MVRTTHLSALQLSYLLLPVISRALSTVGKFERVVVEAKRSLSRAELTPVKFTTIPPGRFFEVPRYPPTPTTMPQTVDLFCLVRGDELKRAFSVRMEPTDTIARMKKAIRAEKQSFKEIDANALQLWKVSEWYLHMLR